MSVAAPLPGADRLWTVSEVAQHMRVSNMTVYRLIKSGELRAIRVGKNYRIPSSHLDEFFAGAGVTSKN